MIFRQLFDNESCTYTYLVADSKTRAAAIFDPVAEQFDRDLNLVNEIGLKIEYVIETHVHADHVTSAFQFRKELGAKIVAGIKTQLECADLLVQEGEVLKLGELEIRALLTPGHTSGCACFYLGDRVLTGDTLMIRGCGRTDFQEGSAETLFQSVREKLFSLPEETLIFPGHDYKGRTCSSIGEEKKHNPRLKMGNSLEKFVQVMNDLKLPYPKKIDIAVPANSKCGCLE